MGEGGCEAAWPKLTNAGGAVRPAGCSATLPCTSQCRATLPDAGQRVRHRHRGSLPAGLGVEEAELGRQGLQYLAALQIPLDLDLDAGERDNSAEDQTGGCLSPLLCCNTAQAQTRWAVEGRASGRAAKQRRASSGGRQRQASLGNAGRPRAHRRLHSYPASRKTLEAQRTGSPAPPTAAAAAARCGSPS